MTKVVNLKNSSYDIYIGRSGNGQSGYYGNPHPIGYCEICKRTHTRKDSIAMFKLDFYNRIETDEEYKKRVLSLKDKTLGCFCKPLNCHGDIYKEYLDDLLFHFTK